MSSASGPSGRVVVLGLDLLDGHVRWLAEPLSMSLSMPMPMPMPMSMSPAPPPSFARLVSLGRGAGGGLLSEARVALVVSVLVPHGGGEGETSSSSSSSSSTHILQLAASSGRSTHPPLLLPHYRALSVSSANEQHLLLLEKHGGGGIAAEGEGEGVRVVALLDERDDDHEGAQGKGKVKGVYVHHLDEEQGSLHTYRVGGQLEGVCVCASVTCTQQQHQHQQHQTSVCLRQLEDVATAHFPPSLEHVLLHAYPAPRDPVHSRISVLGDDSLLLKYLNPHALLVVTVSPPSADTTYCNPSTEADLSALALHVTLLDAVSAKVVYRASISGACGPAHAVLLENQIVVTYW